MTKSNLFNEVNFNYRPSSVHSDKKNVDSFLIRPKISFLGRNSDTRIPTAQLQIIPLSKDR